MLSLPIFEYLFYTTNYIGRYIKTMDWLILVIGSIGFISIGYFLKPIFESITKKKPNQSA